MSVEPLASEDALRNRDWVERNLKKVEQATGSRVAYVYVPNTAGLGHAYFKRYFFPQCDKDAIIVDERFNGGGQVADYYIDHLRRPFTAMWATRYGEDIRTPGAVLQLFEDDGDRAVQLRVFSGEDLGGPLLDLDVRGHAFVFHDPAVLGPYGQVRRRDRPS